MSADAPVTEPHGTPRSNTAVRLWIFRGLAVFGVPCALFLALEAALRVGHFGIDPDFFIQDSVPGYVRTNPDFVRLYLPASFDLRPLNVRIPRRKPDGALRVVVLGESAAQGIPVPPFGFCAQLRAQLRARYPGRQVEVINTGIVAINSHVILKLAQSLAPLSPDLVVVYMGNNEVVGPYGPGCAYLSAMPPLWLIRASLAAKATRMGQLITRSIAALPRSGRPTLEWGGMAMFVNTAVRGDDPRLEAVYRNYESNVREIVRVSQASGARVVLCTVASNLKDCPPLLSLHRAALSESDLRAWTSCFEAGKTEWLLGESSLARRDLTEAYRLDPDYAETSFMLGSLDLQEGRTEQARAAFLNAEHWDALRFRPDPAINAIVRKVARDEGPRVRLVDAALDLGSDPASRTPPAGRELFFEHVHLDWPGNYRVALAIAQAAADILGPAPANALWLTPSESASAIGYTAHEQFKVLGKISTILTHPPFSNQLTYPEDQARLARELALAERLAHNPRALGEAKATVDSAIAADSENPDLAKLSEDIEDELGHLPLALAQAHRATLLEPFTFALPADEAIKLSRMGRFDEAEKLLRAADQRLNATDRVLIAPAFADLFSRSSRLDVGRQYLDRLVALHTGDPSLRLIRSRFLRRAGDLRGAEADLRAALSLAPETTEALESLVSLLSSSGRVTEAEAESLAGFSRQSRNLSNNLRSAVLFERSHDEANATRALIAAEQSGPVPSTVEIHLAKLLFRANALQEALRHLALAQRLSRYEGNSRSTQDIAGAIGDVERALGTRKP